MTNKRAQLLKLIRAGHGRRGIYALARKADRPYRRVHDAVQAFAAAGLVRLVASTSGRRTLAVDAIPAGKAPAFEFNRAYSAPGVVLPPESQVAMVIAQPSFRDLLACVDHFGLPFVERVRAEMLARGELGATAARTTRTLLDDLVIGRARRGRNALAA